MKTGVGLELSRRFYNLLVAPILQASFPYLKYSAARIGMGSEVQGFEDVLSSDHDYGPCVQIFLAETDFATAAPAMMATFDRLLPPTFEGWPVRYPTNIRPPANGQPGMLGSDHGAELYTFSAWSDRFLGRRFDSELSTTDWLSYSEQLFLMVTAGAVFRDDLGELGTLRDRLTYFPRDVWLYKLAVQWGRIAEERAYVGRAGSTRDDMGSQVIAARMVENIMRLAMLIERRYAPYAKWFGTAFSHLDCAAAATPLLQEVLQATGWQEREASLMEACQFMAELQIRLDVPGALSPEVARLHSRPFQFIDTLNIGQAIKEQIEVEHLKTLPEFGGADQFLSGYVLAVPDWSRATFAALAKVF